MGSMAGARSRACEGGTDLTETRFGQFMSRAREAGRAVGAFTCYDLLGFEAGVRGGES